MCKAKFMPMGANTFTVQVLSYNNGEMTGLVYGAALATPATFSSLAGLIMLVDGYLDIEAVPQPAAPTGGTECIATLELDVLFRQNHSWQGSVRWLDAQSESPFRSVLELLFLIEAVLGE